MNSSGYGGYNAQADVSARSAMKLQKSGVAKGSQLNIIGPFYIVGGLMKASQRSLLSTAKNLLLMSHDQPNGWLQVLMNTDLPARIPGQRWV